MTLKPAARLSDNHVCPAHGGGPLVGPGAPLVLVNGRPLTVGTDNAICLGGPTDAVVTGAQTVLAHRRLAARATDHMMHGGVLAPPLSPNVFIGGPAAGVAIGNLDAAGRRCKLEATGRASKLTRQSYGNCGAESSRQLINQQRERQGLPPIGEDALLNQSIANGDARSAPGTSHHGSTNQGQREHILANNGVANESVPQTGTTGDLDVIAQHTRDGRGVITGHRAGALWGTSHSGYHAVSVVGVQYDANGQPSQVIVNDTGRAHGNCLRRYPAQRFVDSLRPDYSMNVTHERVW